MISIKHVLTLLTLLICLPSFADITPVIAKQGMVVSEQRVATQVGVDILLAGGNAIDAAIAVGYALAVTYPCCGNIGGGGFMTIHLANGKNIFINFREKAPLKATSTLFQNSRDTETTDDITQSYLSVAVPGTVLGFETALNKYGTFTREQVIAPAIKLAKEGYVVTPYDAKWFAVYADDLARDPYVASIFLKQGKPYKAGEKLIQADLAATLQLISNHGVNAFYKGSIAKDIVTASKKEGGILSLADFEKYNVEELAPITCQYKGYQIISSAPPSSGGITLCEMLNILSHLPMSSSRYDQIQDINYILEAMRYAYRDRNEKLGDPNFIDNPIAELLSPEYAEKISQHIKAKRFVDTTIEKDVKELSDTTHYSVIDNKGNAVSVTYTLNGFFGSKLIAKPTGFFLNDEMDDFATKVGVPNRFGLIQHDANNIQPGKRPLSSMTPTIVLKDGKVKMVLGSPGGPRIITSVLLTLLNVIDKDMNIKEAVDASRYHFQGNPNFVDMEPLAFSFTLQKSLHYLGYRLLSQGTWGAVEAIYIDNNGNLLGANDKRRPDGAALGY